MKKVLSLLVAVVFVATAAGLALAAPSQKTATKSAKSSFSPFAVYVENASKDNHYAPSGWMGDYGDLKLNQACTEMPRSGNTCIKITYSAKMAQGAGWTGIFWQQPANNWGDKKGGYDLGIAFDGDADRCLFIDEDGNDVDGDMTMFVNAMYLKKQNKLIDNKIVITVMSNLGLKKVLEQKGISYEEVNVGDKYVQARLKEKHLSLGGEQSGHVIFNEDLNTGDGMLTAIHTLNVMCAENASLKQLNADFVKYPQVLQNVGVSNKEAIMENEDLKNLIENLEADLNGDGRILVRPSGTEQLVRVMVEAKSIDICKEVASKLVIFITGLSY